MHRKNEYNGHNWVIQSWLDYTVNISEVWKFNK